jgi:hypothetical protein
MFFTLSYNDKYFRYGCITGKYILLDFSFIISPYQQGHHTQVDLTGGITQPYSPIINLTTNPAGIISTFSVSTSMHCTAFGHSTGKGIEIEID